MIHATTIGVNDCADSRRRRPDPLRGYIRRGWRRLDRLRDAELSPPARREMYRLWVELAHGQPPPALRPALRRAEPAADES